MEEIIILGKSIINDIRMMDKKSLDISLIQDDKSDITFFNIDEEESNETLKALKQSYVTTNYKEETILNLQNTLNSSSDDASKELKIESYKKYNEALNLASRNYITTATEIIEKASELNPKDVDILNLRGLLKLLKCDFSKSFESFYTAMCYGNNELSRKYVDILSSDEFKVFLGRYNHSIRFINEDLNQESIHILNNIIEEDPDLIEPYVILALLYDKMGNLKKKEYYLDRLEQVDKDNPLFENKIKSEDKETKVVEKKTKKKINIMPYAIAGILAISMVAYHISNKNIGYIDYPMNIPVKELSPREAFYNEKKSVKIYDSIGKICGEYIIPYPPGICLVSPGEIITKEVIDYILVCHQKGMSISGMKDPSLGYIQIIENSYNG